MAIIPYTSTEQLPETISILEEYHDNSTQINKSVFSAIGSYWTNYYSNIDAVNTIFSGAVNLLSQEYLELLNLVLSSNILSIPLDNPYRLKILVFSSADKITNYTPGESGPSSFDFTMDKLVSMNALVTSIFNPEVCLSNGTHFEVIGNKIRFYVDIFNDPSIIKDAYKVSTNSVEYILLLAVDLVLDEYSIYNKFGTFMYKKLPNTLSYKLITTALQLFYTGNTNVSLMETTLNILLGLPFCGKSNEEVLVIVPSLDNTASTLVYTNKSIYSAHPWATLLVEVGDKLSIGTLIARWTLVSDLISNPTWYYHSRFPYELFCRFEKWVKRRNRFSWDLSFLYNGRYKYDGSKSYTGPINQFITDPALAFKYAQEWYISNKYSREEFEVWLYEQYEGYLKYNTYSIKTNITHATYPYYRDVRTQFLNINKGTPVYLYPIVDTILTDTIEDRVGVLEEWHSTLVFRAFEDWVRYEIPAYVLTYSDPAGTGSFLTTYLSTDESDGAQLTDENGLPLSVEHETTAIEVPVYLTDESDGAMLMDDDGALIVGSNALNSFSPFFNSNYTYGSGKEFRLLQLDDSAFSITIKLRPEDYCRLTHYPAGYFSYNGVYFYDGSKQYLGLTSVDEDFSFIIISKQYNPNYTDVFDPNDFNMEDFTNDRDQHSIYGTFIPDDMYNFDDFNMDDFSNS